MKRNLAIVIGLIMLFVLSACGQSATSGKEDKKGTNEKVIRVATDSESVPFTYLNTKTHELDGLLIDVIKEIGKRTDYKIELQNMEWTALIPSVQTGKADAVVAAMYTTEERKKIIDFTEPVFGYGEGLIVQEGDHTTKTLEQLKGKTVGVQMGTSYKDMLDKKASNLKLNIKSYKASADMVKDLENKRIDAMLSDKPIFQYMKVINPGLKINIVDDYKPELFGNIGIGVNKDNKDLLNKLNAAIKDMKEDGSLKEIYKKWKLDYDYEKNGE
ncbi:substrate-binding periplasmic protein [Neobacillus sp. M.A.Huq-85]